MVKRNFTSGTLANTVTSWSDSYETKVVEGGATTNTSYYFVNGQLIAKKDNSGNRTFFHNDHLGSTSVVTNSSGSLVETTKYDPWGKINVGGTSSKFLYTGQENDTETGLHYYNARYYNADIRRFTQPDDIIQDVYNPQSLNRYSYAWNNPLRYTDPTGHINEILKYNQALNNYYKKPSAKTYNNVLNTASSIQKQTKSTGSSAPSGGNKGGNSSNSGGTAFAGAVAVGGATNGYSVYVGRDTQGVIQYAGSTRQLLEARFAQHLRSLDPLRNKLRYEGVGSDFSRMVARGGEQILIETYDLIKNGANKINAISPMNPMYQQAKDAAYAASAMPGAVAGMSTTSDVIGAFVRPFFILDYNSAASTLTNSQQN